MNKGIVTILNNKKWTYTPRRALTSHESSRIINIKDSKEEILAAYEEWSSTDPALQFLFKLYQLDPLFITISKITEQRKDSKIKIIYAARNVY